MMKKGALALLLAVLLLALAGCGEQDPEKVAQTVVAEVGGVRITKGEAEKVYAFMMNQTVSANAQQGYEVDPLNQQVITQVKGSTLTMMTEGLALEQKLAELGNPITEEDRAGFAQVATDEYNATVEAYMSAYGTSEAQTRAAIDNMGYSIDALTYMIYRQEIRDRLSELADLEVEITDADIQAEYEALYATAGEAYEANPTQFVDDLLNGRTIYIKPEGFRYIKNLLIGFADDVRSAITEKQNEAYTLMMEQYTAQNQLSSGTELTDEQRASLEATVAGNGDKITALQQEIDAMKEEAMAVLRPEAEAVLAKAREDGADFDALMAEYNMDTATGELIEKGYPVGAGVTTYVQSFTDGAMALETIGEVSDLIESTYGFHILQYAGNIISQITPLDEIREIVESRVESAKRQEAYTAHETAWLDEAEIKTYVSRF